MTHSTLSSRITTIITNLGNIGEFANVTDLAYNETVGNPAGHKPFGVEDFAMMISNGHMVRAVVNASLIIAQLRADASDEGRLQVIRDIESWTLAEGEKMIARMMANATWWVGNAAKDLTRVSKGTCVDYATYLLITEDPVKNAANQKEIMKDDNLLVANAKLLLQKLNN